jgi:hypothetical protein
MGRTIDLTKGKIEVIQGQLSDETRALLEGPSPVQKVKMPKCERCGDCCRWVILEMPVALLGDIEWIKSFQRKGHILKLVAKRLFLCIYGKCEHLSLMPGTGCVACDIQDNKPACCSGYHCSFDPVIQALRKDRQTLRMP